MVSITYILDLSNTKSLDSFDDITYMAFGDSNTTPLESQTTLNNELLRVPVFDVTKDTVNNTYKFSGRVPITKLNSDNIYEIGLFNAITAGDLGAIIVLDTVITKTSDDELIFTLIIQVNSINV